MDIRCSILMLSVLVPIPCVLALNTLEVHKSSVVNHEVPSVVRQEPGDFPLLCGIIGGVPPAATANVYDRIVHGQIKLFNILKKGMLDKDTVVQMRDKMLPVIFANWNTYEISSYMNWPEDISKISMNDQKHIPVLVFNNPQIPDRMNHVLDHPESHDPLPEIRKTAQSLLDGGANCLAISSNVGQQFLPEVRKAVGEDITILDMAELTIKYANRRFPGKDPLILGLLAVKATLHNGIFQHAAEHVSKGTGRNITIITPETVPRGRQDNVMAAIFDHKGIRAGFDHYPCIHGPHCGLRNYDLLDDEAEKFERNGAAAIIVGCSEIPLVFNQDTKPDMVVLNPIDILADNIVHLTYNSHFKDMHGDNDTAINN